MTNWVRPVGDNDLPALYRSTDRQSSKAQTRYVLLFRWDLALMVLGAGLSLLAPTAEPDTRRIAAAAVVMLALSLLITIALAVMNFERTWYGGRAMAESAKSLAWKYMARAEPFGPAIDEPSADRTLVSALTDVLRQADQLAIDLPSELEDGEQITSRMRELRGSAIATRKAAYKTSRIRNQRRWYADKAEVNRGREHLFFGAVALSQLLAIASGLTAMIWTDVGVGWPGFFSAMAAALLAWMQVRRHQELAQSYAVAAHELEMITVELRHIEDDESFADFVASAEAAISREHTLWVARRDPRLARQIS